jgi:hypothetical protein
MRFEETDLAPMDVELDTPEHCRILSQRVGLFVWLGICFTYQKSHRLPGSRLTTAMRHRVVCVSSCGSLDATPHSPIAFCWNWV